ncbi:MAG: hypothetical protein GVY19_13510 [Bacteroidetes bacterium]|jgi:hypothetical protein|nr:hypothetical protein [Bacteroidota bacterium]
MTEHLCKYAAIIGSFLITVAFTSVLIRTAIPWLRKENPNISKNINEADHIEKVAWHKNIGFWIGLFEIMIIYVLAFHREYSALAIIIGAKEYVRKEKIVMDPIYYMLGTIINIGIALVMVAVTKEVIRFI